MRVFVAGASGVIGQRLVPLLVARGHEVTGMTRTPEKARLVRSLGAEPVVCDVYDADALLAAVRDAEPQAVVHELTDLPKAIDGKTDFRPNNRVRTEGTGNLVAAAQEAGARRLVAQSIAFVYARTGEGPKREEDELDAAGGSIVEATTALERQALEAAGMDGLVLRYGYFYGPGTAYAPDGSYAKLAHARRLPVIGRGTGVFSFVHVDDAAAATALAVEGGAPGIYNVVDDEPAPAREWIPVYAEVLGAPKPRRVPAWLARRAAGELAVRSMLETRGASNEKAKRELRWQPRWASWREGFREALG